MFGKNRTAEHLYDAVRSKLISLDLPVDDLKFIDQNEDAQNILHTEIHPSKAGSLRCMFEYIKVSVNLTGVKAVLTGKYDIVSLDIKFSYEHPDGGQNGKNVFFQCEYLSSIDKFVILPNHESHALFMKHRAVTEKK